MTADSVLIVQTGFLGDAALASSLVRAIASARPEMRIGLLVRSATAEIYDVHPAVHRVYALDKRSTSIADISAEIADARYGAALVPHRSLRSALIVVRAGIPIRIGFDAADAPWLYTHRVPYRIADHETRRNERLAALLIGRDIQPGAGTWLVPSRTQLLEMRARFGDRPLVLLAPGSVWATKRWTAEGFVAVARALAADGVRVVLIGSADERALCDAVASQAGLAASDNLAGETSPAELLALCAVALRVVSNDSAALHVAEAVGTPVTAIFGPTVPGFGFGPRLSRSTVLGRDELACRPCRIHGGERCPIGTHECMTLISPDAVLATCPSTELREGWRSGS